MQRERSGFTGSNADLYSEDCRDLSCGQSESGSDEFREKPDPGISARDQPECHAPHRAAEAKRRVVR